MQLLLTGVLALIASGAGQAGAPPASSAAAAPAQAQGAGADRGDIIVEGYRYRTDLETRTSQAGKVNTVRSRLAYEYSERLAKCAARSRLSDLTRFRAVVDGDVNTAAQRSAQDRLVRNYITCSESPSLLAFSSPPEGAAELAEPSGASGSTLAGTSVAPSIAPLGGSIYDRGAFTVQALKLFAPDLALTRRDTGDLAVQARFNAREGPRNRWRLPEDFRYFEVAVCMVRVEPKLALRLAMSDGPAQSGDMQAALIDRARVCVGGAKKVRVDPTQFRLYIADAVYRWAVAARGVDTLISDGPGVVEVRPVAASSPS